MQEKLASWQVVPGFCSGHLKEHTSDMDIENSELLFAYGTLQTETVQLSLFGRKLDGRADTLVGYRLRMIRIEDEEFVQTSGTANHRNLEFTGDANDSVAGTAFVVTRSELEQADAYEPDGYERVMVQLRSGVNAWVYLQQTPIQIS